MVLRCVRGDVGGELVGTGRADSGGTFGVTRRTIRAFLLREFRCLEEDAFGAVPHRCGGFHEINES